MNLLSPIYARNSYLNDEVREVSTVVSRVDIMA